LPSSFVETSIKLRENELLAPLFFSWKSKTKIYIYHLLKGERVAQSIFQPGENLSPVNERAIVATVIHLSSIIMRFRPESRINPSKQSKQISNSKMPKHPIESLAGEISDRFMSNASGIYGPLLNYFPAPRGSCHSFLDH